jgi:hypothetical protein
MRVCYGRHASGGSPPRNVQPIDANTLFPRLIFLDDCFGIGGPGKGLGILIGLGEVSVDGGLEIDDALEDAVLESLPGQFGEKPFNRVEPRGRCRGEVEVEPGMPFEPGSHLGDACASHSCRRSGATPARLASPG